MNVATATPRSAFTASLSSLRRRFGARSAAEHAPRPVTSPCPRCGGALRSAELVERDGDLHLRRNCPTHGVVEELYARDADLFRRIREAGSRLGRYARPRDAAGSGPLELTTNIAIDLTEACGYPCPTCFAQADDNGAREPSLDEILAGLPQTPPGHVKPNLVLIGGEPTRRKDLPEILRALHGRGYVARVTTHGERFLDRDYLRTLVDAGMRWVILQFDGFHDDIYKTLRGKPLLAKKRRILDALHEEGVGVHLAVMVAKGINDREVGPILRFAVAHPAVKRVSFYPMTPVGRWAPPNPKAVAVGGTRHWEMHLADMFARFAETTDGDVTGEDILATKRLWALLYRWTGKAVFRQRACITPFVLVGKGDRLHPVNRFLRPLFVLTHPRLAWNLARAVPRLLRYDEGRWPSNVLFVNVEKFYSQDALDVDSATDCHMVYFTSKGYVPFCLYNSVHRDTMGWGASAPARPSHLDAPAALGQARLAG
ncbi:MAG: radical SAM protein [bacterium]